MLTGEHTERCELKGRGWQLPGAIHKSHMMVQRLHIQIATEDWKELTSPKSRKTQVQIFKFSHKHGQKFSAIRDAFSL